MSKKLKAAIIAIILCLFAAGATESNEVYAATDTTSKIAELLKKIQTLQDELKRLRGEVRETIHAELKEGVTSSEVKEIQELLATDPDIYPRGLVTGYFGPMTKDAVKKFQKKAGILESGVVDQETRELFEEMLKDRFNGKVPPGLLRAPGIFKKFQDRVHAGKCTGDTKGKAPFCKPVKEDEHDEDEDVHEHELDISVEFEDGDARIRIDFEDGKRRNLILENETDEEEIIEFIVDETDLSEEEVRDAIEFDDSTWGKEVKKIEVEVGSSTAEATVEYKDNIDDASFDFDTDDRDNIVEELADELGLDEDDILGLIEWSIAISSDVEEIVVQIDDGDAEIEITFESGHVMQFVYEDEDDESDIIELLASELDMDEDDVEDIIEFN